MNQETKKKVLVLSVFAIVILAMVVYVVIVFGDDDNDSGQLGQFNTTFSTPTNPSKIATTDYDTKLNAYKQEREKGNEPDAKPIEVPFLGETASPDSLAFITQEERQQYVIDSLKRQLVTAQQDQSYSSPVTTAVPKRSAQPPRNTRKNNSSQPIVIRQKEDNSEEDEFANFELNRTSNPLDKKSTSNSSQQYNHDKYYEGKFIENQTLVIGNDQSINLRNTESIPLRNDTNIPRNTVMKGVVSKVGNRLLIRINQVETFDGNIPVQLAVFHPDYNEGLPLQSENEFAKKTKDKLNEVVDGASSKTTVTIPFTGIPISLSPKLGGRLQEKIAIPASMTFKLRVLHQ